MEPSTTCLMVTVGVAPTDSLQPLTRLWVHNATAPGLKPLPFRPYQICQCWYHPTRMTAWSSSLRDGPSLIQSKERRTDLFVVNYLSSLVHLTHRHYVLLQRKKSLHIVRGRDIQRWLDTKILWFKIFNVINETFWENPVSTILTNHFILYVSLSK